MGGSVFEGVPALQTFSITPALNAYLAGAEERRTQETHTSTMNTSAIEALGRLAVSADTPEKWGAFVERVQARFPGADLGPYRDFSARDAALAEFDPYFSDRQEAQQLLGRALSGGGAPQPQQQPMPQAAPPQVRIPNAPVVAQPTVPQGAPGWQPDMDPDVTGAPQPVRPPRPGPLVNAQGQSYQGPGAVSVPVDFKLANDTMQGMTPQAMTMLGAAQTAAANAGLARIEVVGANDVGPRGHRSHMYGTEFDLVGYNADGSRWTTEQRVQVASAAREAGGNRFGFYPGGSLHAGVGAPGLPQNVAWGPGGQLSGVPVSAFAPEEQEFVTTLRGGVPFEQVAQAGAQMGVSPQLADFYSVLGSPGFDRLSTAQQNFVVDQIERLSAASAPPDFGFMNVDGTVVRTDPVAGTATPVYGPPTGGIAPYFAGTSVDAQALNHMIEAGRITRAQADDLAAGKTITDPATGAQFFFSAGQLIGVDGASGAAGAAPAAGAGLGTQLTGGRPARQDQEIASGFAQRMATAVPTISQYEDAGSSLGQWVAGKIPVFGNFITSPEYQQFDTAARDFVNAVLRRESGATITDQEFTNAYLQYIPQPGDSPERLAQKAAAREVALRNMQSAAGPAFRPAQVVTPSALPPAVPQTTPTPAPAPAPPSNTTAIQQQPRTMAPAPYFAPQQPASPPAQQAPPAAPPSATNPQPFAAAPPEIQTRLRGVAAQLVALGKTPEQIIAALAERGYIATPQDLGL